MRITVKLNSKAPTGRCRTGIGGTGNGRSLISRADVGQLLSIVGNPTTIGRPVGVGY